MEIFVIGLILLIPSTVLAAICYFIYRISARFNYPKLGIAISAGLILFILFNIYTAIYPSDDFYFDEYKAITLKDAPKSAVIIRKSASYPDQHDTYCSAALIKLSSEDYKELLKSIKQSKTMIPSTQNHSSEEYEYVMGSRDEKDVNYLFTKVSSGETFPQKYIGFFKDQRTVIIYRCTL